MGMFGSMRTGFNPAADPLRGTYGGAGYVNPQAMMGGDPNLAAPGVTGAPPVAPAPKPGFFSSNGAGVNILGAIGDALSVAGGGHASFLPVLAQQRQQDFLLRKQAADNAADYERQVALAQFKAAHPEPDAFARSLTAAGIDPASAQGQALYRQKIQNDVDPVHAYPTTDANGNEGLIFRRSGDLGQPTAAPAGVTFTPRTSGGAAPATGPGGFPLYPKRH